jgi:hypothetical protein
MHWFWRVAIAVVAACGCGGLLEYSFAITGHDLSLGMAKAVRPVINLLPRGVHVAETMIVDFLPVLIVGFVVYGVLTRLWGPVCQTDNETRCRKCGYILRGISEPRCPECGERI